MTASTHAHLGCEPLETRDTPAGNVAVLFNGSSYFLQGDASDNQVDVTQDPSGNVVVTGLAGTTVDGQASRNLGVVSGSAGGFAPGGLAADLGDGTDYLETHGVAVQAFNVEQYGGDSQGPVSNGGGYAAAPQSVSAGGTQDAGTQTEPSTPSGPNTPDSPVAPGSESTGDDGSDPYGYNDPNDPIPY